jgi:hypothetical protein
VHPGRLELPTCGLEDRGFTEKRIFCWRMVDK